MSRDGRLGVGVIGAGRVGPVVGAALAGAGHALVGITSGSDDERVSAILPDVPFLAPDEILRRSELVVLAVPHGELAALVAGLAEVGAWQPGQLVLHTDPGHGLAVLEPARLAGAIPLAVHPAIVFSGTSMDLRQLRDSFAGVSAPAAALPIAQALAVEMGCEPVVIAEADRGAYAEAVATASEFSRAIIGQATALLEQVGVENPGGFLSALVSSSVERALREASDPLEVPDLESD